MIYFIDNQFSGITEDGLHRSRVFRIDEPEYRNVGMITALPSLGIVRIITIAPEGKYQYSGSEEVVAEVVNKAERAAQMIVSLLNLAEADYEFDRSA